MLRLPQVPLRSYCWSCLIAVVARVKAVSFRVAVEVVVPGECSVRRIVFGSPVVAGELESSVD